MHKTKLFEIAPSMHNATPVELTVDKDTVNYLHDQIVALQLKVKKLHVALTIVAIAGLVQAIANLTC
jgi:hypothetical protein